MSETPFDTLKRLRSGYGTPMTPAENAALLNDTAYTHRSEGWGVLSKDSGSNCPRSDGAMISRDILLNKTTRVWVDCLQDSEGIGKPMWDENPGADMSDYLNAIAPATAPPVPVPEPPTPVPHPPAQPVTSYGQWVNVEIHLLVSAYISKHGGNYPGASDFAHLSYRRLVERWTIAAMIADI